jgi:hypothetical protein
LKKPGDEEKALKSRSFSIRIEGIQVERLEGMRGSLMNVRWMEINASLNLSILQSEEKHTQVCLTEEIYKTGSIEPGIDGIYLSGWRKKVSESEKSKLKGFDI